MGLKPFFVVRTRVKPKAKGVWVVCVEGSAWLWVRTDTDRDNSYSQLGLSIISNMTTDQGAIHWVDSESSMLKCSGSTSFFLFFAFSFGVCLDWVPKTQASGFLISCRTFLQK